MKSEHPPERVRTAEAVRITGLSQRTLQEKAAAGLIPGARKVFGRWSFDVCELARLGTAPRIVRNEIGMQGRIARVRDEDTQKAYERVLGQKRSGR